MTILVLFERSKFGRMASLEATSSSTDPSAKTSPQVLIIDLALESVFSVRFAVFSSVVAAELSASGAQVLVIESGGPDDAPTFNTALPGTAAPV